MNDGVAFKNIRNSRGISQNDIIKNKLSRTTISKFENNKITLSMNNFNYLIESIDVSFEEFNFIKNGYAYNDKEQIIHLFNQFFSNSDFYFIDELIQKCELYLSKNFSKSIKCIQNTLNILKHTRMSSNDNLNCLAKLYAADTWNELSNIDTWTILDIKIINCCLHFFDPSTYVYISEQLVNSLNKYKDFSNIILLETSIYLNLTLLFSLQKNIDKARYFANISLLKAKQSKRIDYISISMIRIGILFKKQEQLHKGLNLLNVLDDSSLEASIQEEIIFFKKIIP